MRWMDILIALVVAMDVLTGHLLAQRQVRTAEQLPSPEVRAQMLEQARRTRTTMMIVSPAVLVVIYLLLLCG